MEQSQKDELRTKFEHTKDFLKSDFKFKTPPSELSDGQISDMVVQLRELKSMIESREKTLGEVLKARHANSLDEIKEAYIDEGNKYQFAIPGEITGGIQYEYVVQRRLDGESVKQEMGDEWYEEHTKLVDFFQARVIK